MEQDYSVEAIAQRNLATVLGSDVRVISVSLPDDDPAGEYDRIQVVVTNLGHFTIGWRSGGFDVMA